MEPIPTECHDFDLRPFFFEDIYFYVPIYVAFDGEPGSLNELINDHYQYDPHHLARNPFIKFLRDVRVSAPYTNEDGVRAVDVIAPWADEPVTFTYDGETEIAIIDWINQDVWNWKNIGTHRGKADVGMWIWMETLWKQAWVQSEPYTLGIRLDHASNSVHMRINGDRVYEMHFPVRYRDRDFSEVIETYIYDHEDDLLVSVRDVQRVRDICS